MIVFCPLWMCSNFLPSFFCLKSLKFCLHSLNLECCEPHMVSSNLGLLLRTSFVLHACLSEKHFPLLSLQDEDGNLWLKLQSHMSYLEFEMQQPLHTDCEHSYINIKFWFLWPSCFSVAFGILQILLKQFQCISMTISTLH